MMYFALGSDGLVYELGDHGDFDAADETASSIDDLETVWIADEESALQWFNRIGTAMKLI